MMNSLGNSAIITRPSPLTRTILIVDDNHNIAQALARVVGGAGYKTAIFHNGSDALKFAEDGEIDAALIDLHLPDLHGLVLTARLRAILGPAVPIIIVSGDTSMTTLNSLPHVGATYFLSKPVSPALILEQFSLHLKPPIG